MTSALAASELRYHLRLVRWNKNKAARLESLAHDLETLTKNLKSLPWDTSRRESLLRNELLGYVSAYVEWATGEAHDGDLDEIVLFLIGRPSNLKGKFSMKQWRSGHRPFWDLPPRVKGAWTRATEAARSRSHCGRPVSRVAAGP